MSAVLCVAPTRPAPVLAADLHPRGLVGDGVTVAVIDSGVQPSAGFGDRLSFGPDFTGGRGSGIDHTGHGTHLAGIVADAEVGVAPGAGVVSLRVVDDCGNTDVRHIVEAIDWSIAHASEQSIRVILLTFGAHQLPGDRTDPLAAAVRRAWRAGIFVVIAAGNDGRAPLPTPAHVREACTVGSAEQTMGRWVRSDFSTTGSAGEGPDVMAPGRSVVSSLAFGSLASEAGTESMVGERFVKGSGTSQASAAVAGLAAVLLAECPGTSPAVLRDTLASSGAAVHADRAPVVDAEAALDALRDAPQTRDTTTVGAPTFDGASWNAARWAGNSWGGNSWGGNSWGGNSWGGNSWGGNSWGGNSWGGNSWGGNSWGGNSWGGNSWGGNSWGGNSWGSMTWR